MIDGALVSSAGEYVNIGTLRLVSLAVPFSTAAIELVVVAEALSLKATGALLRTGVGVGTDTSEDSGAILETFDGVGATVGVIYEVDRMVCGSSVARGSPSGLRNVMAGTVCVKTVCCMGSMTKAVSASTIW